MINANTGIVTVGLSGLLNFELTSSHQITVRATSQDGSSATATFTIQLIDINEGAVGSISDQNAAANVITENAATGTTVGLAARAVDPDGTDIVLYSLDNNDGGRFAINPLTGVVTLAGTVNRESDGESRSITVRATSTDGSFSTQSFTINIADVDEFDVTTPVDANAAVNSVAENAAIGTTVGITGSAFDIDATTSVVTYSLVNNDGGRFAIDATTGVVTVAGTIDRETEGTVRNITVRATSQDGSTADQTFAINIIDVDEFDVTTPVDANAVVNSVAENAAIGTTVGITANATDSDATTNGVTYSLVNNDGGRFAIDGSTGVVTVAGAINREADGAVRNITVRATSQDGSFADQTFAINIVDVDEFDVTTPVDTNAGGNSVAENAAVGTTVGITGSAVDSDATTSGVTYSLVNNDAGRFAIDANTGVVTVAGAINRETDGAVRSITVRATSQDGSFADQTFAINIVDVDEFDVTTPVDANGA